MPIVAPSLLSANYLNLQADCNMLNESEADWFHLDVMDGRFVPNITFGMFIIEAMHKMAQIELAATNTCSNFRGFCSRIARRMEYAA
jgi:pentose-5-phosphate-3-epimerase